MSLSDKQIKSILKRYEARRLINKKASKERLDEVIQKIPHVKVINDTITDKSLDISKSIFNSPTDRESLLTTLKNELMALKKKRTELLIANKYTADYLDPIYTCALCKDSGYVGDHKCSCFKQAIIDVAYAQSNLQGILQVENFEHFNFDLYDDEVNKAMGISPRENAKSVYAYCKKFTETFDSTFSNLILYGQAGLGKTYLCNCIAKALLDKSKTVVYVTAFQLFRLLETYRFHNNEQIVTYDEIDDIYTCDLLIIDDLVSEIINQFTTSELFNGLNTRILSKKPTVISTNLEPSGWSVNYSNRIVSRIFGHYTPLKLIGNDIRLKHYN
jgi:DNA replication protein DnaC